MFHIINFIARVGQTLGARNSHKWNELKNNYKGGVYLHLFCLTNLNLSNSFRRGWRVSPAGSVGASASQRCPPDTRTPDSPWQSVQTNYNGSSRRRPLQRTKLVISIIATQFQHFAFCVLHSALIPTNPNLSKSYL